MDFRRIFYLRIGKIGNPRIIRMRNGTAGIRKERTQDLPGSGTSTFRIMEPECGPMHNGTEPCDLTNIEDLAEFSLPKSVRT